ncbi:MAG TPA: extracellular solute-binding protein [Anaerolineaceae bacterium]|nr:extracellular solute-binding protein [Anaerolineaceae bacterium]
MIFNKHGIIAANFKHTQKEKSMKKSVLFTAIFLIATLVLGACSQPAPAPTAAPTEAPTEAPKPTEAATEAPTEAAPAATLRIWADDTRAPALEKLAPAFLAEYNVALNIELKSSLRDDFQLAAPLGEGPDILFGIPHDQVASIVANGLAAELDLGEKAAQFVPSTLDACKYDGKLYCMPYATENLAFFYNTDLVETAPTTWDEVVEMGEALKAEDKVDYIMAVTGTTYDLYPLYTAFGGYIFGKDANGNWNDQDLGVDSEGMIAAAQWLKDQLDKGNIPADWDWANNHALFETGAAPFIMAGPWALDRIRQSGIPYAITNFPAGPAGEGYPFSGVQTVLINEQSENKLLAQAFLTEFVATEDTMTELYNVGQRPSAFISVLEKLDDADLIAFGKAGINATAMPAIPAMGSVWGNWDTSILLVRDGKQDAKNALKEGAEKIRALIANPAYGMVNVPGSYQDQAGCEAAWAPECAATQMSKNDEGLWVSGPFALKAGEYEVKVALDGNWTTNYGVDGEANGDNYKFTLDADGEVDFVYDEATHLLTINVK